MTRSLRVVIDANVFVSAAIAFGPSHRVVRAVLLSERLDAIVCPGLIDEIEDVLNRPRLTKRIGADQASAFLEDIRILAIRVSNPAVVEARTRDSDDDYLVALAREHDAAYIVTGDKDLLEWPEQRPPVITPAAFEEIIAEER